MKMSPHKASTGPACLSMIFLPEDLIHCRFWTWNSGPDLSSQTLSPVIPGRLPEARRGHVWPLGASDDFWTWQQNISRSIWCSYWTRTIDSLIHGFQCPQQVWELISHGYWDPTVFVLKMPLTLIQTSLLGLTVIGRVCAICHNCSLQEKGYVHHSPDSAPHPHPRSYYFLAHTRPNMYQTVFPLVSWSHQDHNSGGPCRVCIPQRYF